MSRTKTIRNINGCSPYDISTLDSLKTQLTQTSADLVRTLADFHWLRDVLDGNVGGCFIGRGLDHWLGKYPRMNVYKDLYGQSTYCEPNWVTASKAITYTLAGSLGTSVTNLTELIELEKENQIVTSNLYQQCMEQETELSEQVTEQTTEQTQLTVAETEQMVVAEKLGLTPNPMEKYLPYAAGAIGVYLLLNKNQKNK